MKILAKRTGSGAALAIIAALLLAGMAAAAPGAVGWVGSMFPAGGSYSTMNAGDPFTVYVQVWKAGVTEASGQGAGITCTLYWGKVDSFGGGWSDITDTPMIYNADIGSPVMMSTWPPFRRAPACTSLLPTVPMTAAATKTWTDMESTAS